MADVGGEIVPESPRHPRDRILWNERPRRGLAGGDIDEIVIRNVDVHIEQMDDRCWWIALYTDMNNPDAPYWMGNFVADSRGRMRFVEQENDGIVWGKDDAHEWPQVTPGD